MKILITVGLLFSFAIGWIEMHHFSSTSLSPDTRLAGEKTEYSYGLSTGTSGIISWRGVASEDKWQPMWKAPRDGTVIEMRNSYGVMPWYGLFKWTDMIASANDPTLHKIDQPRWASVTQQGMSQGEESEQHLTWRPAPTTAPRAYVDPTGGAQETPEYWRRGR